MTSLALINQLIGLPANASEHGYQIDHIIEFCHWFMGALFLGWSAFFIFVLWRFRKRRNPVASHEGVTSGISTHLEFAVVLIEAVLLVQDLECAPQPRCFRSGLPGLPIRASRRGRVG